MISNIFLHILFYDIWFYFSHLLLHHPFLYCIHSIHHSTQYKKLIYSDTNVGHIIEHCFCPIGAFIPLLFNNANIYSFIISYIFIGSRAFMRHDNRCSWIVGNHHILHHKYIKYNFGEYWLDSLFGTCYPNKNEYIYGIIYI